MSGASTIVSSVKELAVLPATYMRLARVLDQPGSTSEQIAEAIQIDPALTARVLKLANSAAFSATRRADSVGQATVRIGTVNIRRLALATSIVKMFRGIPEHLLSMDSFWIHSVAVGAAASALARKSGTARPEDVFVAGLLHDVGELLICLQRPLDARRVLIETERTDRPHADVEHETLGFNHADVGGLLLQSWGLPTSDVAAAAFHHDPNAAPHELRPAVDLVHIADVIVSALQIGNAGERSANPLRPEAWTRTSLRSRDIPAVIAQVERQVADLVAAILG